MVEHRLRNAWQVPGIQASTSKKHAGGGYEWLITFPPHLGNVAPIELDLDDLLGLGSDAKVHTIIEGLHLADFK